MAKMRVSRVLRVLLVLSALRAPCVMRCVAFFCFPKSAENHRLLLIFTWNVHFQRSEIGGLSPFNSSVHQRFCVFSDLIGRWSSLLRACVRAWWSQICCNFQWVLVIVRDVEKESEIESEGLQKKGIFFQKTRFCNCKNGKKCVCRACCVCCVRCVRCVRYLYGCFQLFCNHVRLYLFCDMFHYSDFFGSFSWGSI